MKKFCKDIEFGSVIVVEALDNYTDTDWIDKDTILKEEFTPITLMYEGIFLKETPYFLTINSCQGNNGLLRYTHVIPKSLILWIDVVKKTKEIYRSKVLMDEK